MKKIVALLTICSPFFLNAQGFQVNLQGQKQQGMGGTGVAYMQDGAALFFNPGGVSFLKHNSISIGGSPVISYGQYTDAASNTVSETKSPVSYPFTGYVVLGKKDSKLKYGIAAYTPFGSIVDWQDGWTGRFVLTHLQLQSIFIQPTISYKLSDKVGIGAGFVYGMGTVNLQKDIPVVDNKGVYGHATLDGKAQGYGFNAGFYYQPDKKWSIGLTYRSKVQMDLNNGTATFTVPASLSSQFPNGPFSTSLPLPSVMSAGVAFSPNQKLTLALELNRVGWNVYDTLSFHYQNQTASLQDTKSPRMYKNTLSYRIGAQYAINSKLDARLGIKYLMTPVQSGYVNPDVPDANHFNYSAGLGYKLGSHFVVDASFTFEQMVRNDKTIETNMNGTYITNLFIPGFSIAYNF